ncbi:hypothetical protein [Enterovirga sp. CN4-39]|uniref:hypothetical protein n=1 Tax=Enterovirga sp. CN4-39 TaxID=3400910 RepID=UPI003C0F2085
MAAFFFNEREPPAGRATGRLAGEEEVRLIETCRAWIVTKVLQGISLSILLVIGVIVFGAW